jgi:hypothetical protein
MTANPDLAEWQHYSSLPVFAGSGVINSQSTGSDCKNTNFSQTMESR